MGILKKTEPSETCNICSATITGSTKDIAFENLKAHKLAVHGPNNIDRPKPRPRF